MNPKKRIFVERLRQKNYSDVTSCHDLSSFCWSKKKKMKVNRHWTPKTLTGQHFQKILELIEKLKEKTIEFTKI